MLMTPQKVVKILKLRKMRLILKQKIQPVLSGFVQQMLIKHLLCGKTVLSYVQPTSLF